MLQHFIQSLTGDGIAWIIIGILLAMFVACAIVAVLERDRSTVVFIVALVLFCGCGLAWSVATSGSNGNPPPASNYIQSP